MRSCLSNYNTTLFLFQHVVQKELQNFSIKLIRLTHNNRFSIIFINYIKEVDLKSKILPAIVLAIIFTVSGCAVYANIKAPFDRDLNRTDLGSKKGIATAYSVLWLVAWGDASYAAAAKNGDITVLKHADQHTLIVLFGLYTRWHVVVYGD